MKKILLLLVAGAMLASCEKEFLENYNGHHYEPADIDYEFKMNGRCSQDANGYYHLPLIPKEDKQTLHRFGAYVTGVDKWELPTRVTWTCDKFWYTPDTLGFTYIEIGQVPTGESPWSFQNFAVTGYEGLVVTIVNGTSNADLTMDSIYCMMAPIGAMIGDTATVWGKAYFEEGDIIIEDKFKIIFE